MKAAWVDPPSEADPAKLKAWGVDEVYFDARWDRLSLDYLHHVRDGQGFAYPGVYFCSQGEGWPDAHSTAPEAWADWAYNRVQKEIAPGTSGGFPRVHLNCETHDDQWLQAMFKRWRSRSPRRWTGWSMEGHQAGWMNTTFVAALVGLRIDAYLPQAYTGNMRRNESDRVALELVAAGFPVGRVWCMYDAAQVGYWWDGCLYTQGRLP